MYLIIQNKDNKQISTNLMGYFKLFINKYTDNEISHFTIYINKMDTLYSSNIHISEILEGDKYENLTSAFENKYKNFTLKIVH